MNERFSVEKRTHTEHGEKGIDESIEGHSEWHRGVLRLIGSHSWAYKSDLGLVHLGHIEDWGYVFHDVWDQNFFQ